MRNVVGLVVWNVFLTWGFSWFGVQGHSLRYRLPFQFGEKNYYINVYSGQKKGDKVICLTEPKQDTKQDPYKTSIQVKWINERK